MARTRTVDWYGIVLANAGESQLRRFISLKVGIRFNVKNIAILKLLVSAFGGAGRLLVLWRKHGKWDKKFFSVELGVTTQAIYLLRATLVRHGYVDPNNKRELRPSTKEAASEQGK